MTDTTDTAVQDMPEFTEGICGDEVVILCDGQRMSISNILAQLNAGAAAEARVKELEALKGEQVPVADVQSVATAIMQTIDAETDKFHSAYTLSELRIAIVKTLTGVFTAPQKPVVLLPPAYGKSADFTEYHQGWNACRNYMLAEAKEVGGIVKDGE